VTLGFDVFQYHRRTAIRALLQIGKIDMTETARSTPAAPVGPARNTDGYSIQAVHLVRTTTQANLTLSQMADQKASILMGATFLVFTLSVGQAANGGISAPLLVMAGFAFVSAFCAVLAIMPSIRPPKAPLDRQNLLFFGNFAAFSEDEFVDYLLDRLKADETVFRTMLRDIYQNGQVLLNKKYRFLHLAYLSFLAGLTLTLIAFVAEYGREIGQLLT
jgi:Family of unknown function (DUF5706)